MDCLKVTVTVCNILSLYIFHISRRVHRLPQFYSLYLSNWTRRLRTVSNTLWRECLFKIKLISLLHRSIAVQLPLCCTVITVVCKNVCIPGQKASYNYYLGKQKQTWTVHVKQFNRPVQKFGNPFRLLCYFSKRWLLRPRSK